MENVEVLLVRIEKPHTMFLLEDRLNHGMRRGTQCHMIRHVSSHNPSYRGNSELFIDFTNK